MRNILVAIILLATCGAARAELTQEAKAEIGKQISALYDLPNTFSFAFGDMKANPERIPDYRSVFGAFAASNGANGMLKQFRGIIWLIDGNGSGFGPAGENFLATASRDEVIQRGINEIAGAAGSYDSAVLRLEVMIASYPECAETRCSAEILRDAVQDAADTVRAFNSNHDWTEPRLQNNLDFSAASGSKDLRVKSATAGPHGDYRRLLSQMVGFRQYVQHAMVDFMAAAETGNDEVRAQFRKTAGKFANLMRICFVVTGLAVGSEHWSVAGDIESMFDQGSTGRGREFFQVITMQQMLINVGPGGPNGFGLNEERGAAGYFTAIRLEYHRAMMAAFGNVETLSSLVESQEHLTDGWGRSDEAAWDGTSSFLLKNPPFGGGGSDPPGNGDLPPFVCGEGTTQTADGVCAADILECPAAPDFLPQLFVDTTGVVTAQCVEVQ